MWWAISDQSISQEGKSNDPGYYPGSPCLKPIVPIGIYRWPWTVLNLPTRCHRKHDDVIKWKHFPRNWPFVRGIHRSPVNSPHKGQWRGALMFSLICVWINNWVNNREAGDLRRYRAHYDVIVMKCKLAHSKRHQVNKYMYVCNKITMHSTGRWFFSPVHYIIIHRKTQSHWLEFRRYRNSNAPPHSIFTIVVDIFHRYLFIRTHVEYCHLKPLTCGDRVGLFWRKLNPQKLWAIWGVYGNMNQLFFYYTTHWDRDKMTAISPTTHSHSNAFCWKRMSEFRVTFHWSLFPMVQLAIFQYWFRWWLGTDQATSHYLNKWWLY